MKSIQVGEFGDWFNSDQYIAYGYEFSPEHISTGLFSASTKKNRWKVWVLLTGNGTLENYTYNEQEAIKACQKIAKELKKTL